MSDRFDQHIRSRIYPVETDVPTHLWEAIEQQLRPKKKRRWIFFLIPSLLIFGLYWFITGGNYESNSELLDLRSDVEPLKSKSDANTSFSEIPLEATFHNVRSDYTAIDSAIRQNAQAYLLSASSKDLRKNKANTQQAGIVREINVPIVLDSAPESTLESNVNQMPNRLHDPLTILRQVNFAPNLQAKDPKIDICPSFSNRLQIRPFVEFSLSGGLPERKLTQNDREFSDYLTLRDRTERERISLSARGLFGIEIGDRLEVKTGLSSTRIYEVFDYIDQSATRTITTYIADTITAPDGTQQVIIDTSIVTQYGQRIKYSQNRYTTLDIPLLAAYKFKVQHHQFFLQAGAIYNLALWTRGDILSPDEEIVSIDTRKGAALPIFNRNVGMDFTAALGYELELSEKNKLRILCSLRQNFGNFTRPEYPLNQRYKHLHLGVSWKHQF